MSLRTACKLYLPSCISSYDFANPSFVCGIAACGPATTNSATSASASGPEFRDAKGNRRCPACQTYAERVVGFAAPMNLPGEESVDMEVDVHLLQVDAGRIAFHSTYQTAL